MTKADELRRVARRIEEEMVCPLKDAATNLVFGKGNPDAEIMFIGEAPGQKEDEEGFPFVGRAGQELDTLLNVVGLSLDDVYIANVLKYRPPKNRDPTMEEIKRHTPYLVEQILTIKPRVLITLGNFSTKFVLSKFKPTEMKKVQGISKLHGRHIPFSVDGLSCTVMPIYHPAAMLYNPKLRDVMKKDFLSLKDLLGQRTLG